MNSTLNLSSFAPRKLYLLIASAAFSWLLASHSLASDSSFPAPIQKYMDWEGALKGEADLLASVNADIEKCVQRAGAVKGDKILRKKAIAYQSCEFNAYQEKVIPFALFPDLISAMQETRLQIARDYQGKKIEKDEANQREDKASQDYLSEFTKRTSQVILAQQFFKCSCLYRAWAEIQGSDSAWNGKAIEAANENLMGSIANLKLAYMAKRDRGYFLGEKAFDDISIAHTQETALWVKAMKVDDAKLEDSLGICKNLMREDKSLTDQYIENIRKGKSKNRSFL